MIKKTAIVTALFDIGRDNWDSFELSYNTYLYWFESLLKYDNKMIIYTDHKLKEKIIESRKKTDPNLDNTIFIIKNLEELKSYELFYPRVNQIMNSQEFKNKIQFQVPEMTKVLYNIVIFNKLYMMQESVKNNYFDADFYIWVDAGAIRHQINDIQKKWPNLDKINEGYSDKITFFNHQDNVIVNDAHWHLLGQLRQIHGGCFFIPKKSELDLLINDFEFLINKYLDEGYVGAEEKYYDMCYLKRPNNYNLVKSDWRKYFEIFA
jgi:hypothetical protein